MTFDQWMTILSVVGTGVGLRIETIYRENRNHQWEVDEHQRRDAERKEEAEALALKVKLNAELLQQQLAANANMLQRGHIELKRDVAAATSAAKDAFQEANSINNKISDLNDRIIQTQEKPPEQQGPGGSSVSS